MAGVFIRYRTLGPGSATAAVGADNPATTATTIISVRIIPSLYPERVAPPLNQSRLRMLFGLVRVAWVKVKQRWDLSMDAEEAVAIDAVPAGC